MMLHFASCDHNAKRYLASEAYDWLPLPVKEFVLNNLAPDLKKGFRVQDPMMHPNPQLMTENPDLHREALRLMTEGKAA